MSENTMATFMPLDNTLSSIPPPDEIATRPPMCCYCGKPLAITDKVKSTGRYWKSCQKCRDELTAKRRERARLNMSADISIGSSKCENKRKEYRNVLEEPGFLAKRARADTIGGRGSRDGGSCPHDFDSTDEEDDEEDFLIKREPISASDSSSFCNSDTEATIECTVCTLDFPTHTFPVLSSCTHPPSVCRDCFTQWLTTQMANIEPIPCPSTACTTFLTHSDVQTHAPLPLFTRYDDLNLRSLLSSDPSFLYCLRSSCPSGQIHDSGTAGPIFRCAECGFRMCTAHEPVVPFHEDETCAVYAKRVERERQERQARQEADEQRRREEEEASREAVKKDAVECPGCGVMIHKISGCDHITCRRKGCGFEFCYKCRAPYAGDTGIWQLGNLAHEKNCVYHSERLPVLGALFGL